MSGQVRQKRATPPPKIALTPENFNRLIEDHGSFVRVTPAIICPRRSGAVVELDDTNHDLRCPLCFGSLTIDVVEEAMEDYCFMQSVKFDKILDVHGVFDIKDAFASFKNQVRVSYWYKVEMLDFATQYNEIMMRSKTGATDRLRYPFAECEEIANRVFVIDGDGKKYEKDTDFQLTDESHFIEWGSRQPKKGRLYSILYSYLPTFRVLELMHETRNYYVDSRRPNKKPVALPQQAHIRWDFMAKRQGSDRLRS